jgi:hypothetical protein
MPPELYDGFLPDLGMLGKLRQIQRIQRQAGSLRALIVAGDTVLINERFLLRDRRGTHRG